MKNKKINIRTIAIIILLILVIALIFINLNNKNTNIEKESTNKEQLSSLIDNNAYISMSDHLSELSSKQKELDNLQNTVGQATVTEDKILKDYTAYKDGKLITGTMVNNGAVSKALNAGESFTIPAGYHNGSGKITSNSLSNQTQATATANNITAGKTAWVNGELITGNGSDNNNSANSKIPTVLYYVGKNQSTSYNYPATNYNVTSISGSDITVDGYTFKFNRAGTVYLDCRCLYSSSSGSEYGTISYIQILKNNEVVGEFSNTYTNPDTHNLLSLSVNANDVLSFKGKCNVAFWWSNKVIISF